MPGIDYWQGQVSEKRCFSPRLGVGAEHWPVLRTGTLVER